MDGLRLLRESTAATYAPVFRTDSGALHWTEAKDGNPESRAKGGVVQLKIYEPVNADPNAFIEFCATRYIGYDDDCYEANVGQELTEALSLKWFK